MTGPCCCLRRNYFNWIEKSITKRTNSIGDNMVKLTIWQDQYLKENIEQCIHGYKPKHRRGSILTFPLEDILFDFYRGCFYRRDFHGFEALHASYDEYCKEGRPVCRYGSLHTGLFLFAKSFIDKFLLARLSCSMNQITDCRVPHFSALHLCPVCCMFCVKFRNDNLAVKFQIVLKCFEPLINLCEEIIKEAFFQGFVTYGPVKQVCFTQVGIAVIASKPANAFC